MVSIPAKYFLLVLSCDIIASLYGNDRRLEEAILDHDTKKDFLEIVHDDTREKLRIDSCHTNPMYRYKSSDTYLLLDALRRITNFFESYYSDIILDGLIGLRIAEGQLHEILAEIRDSDPFHEELSKARAGLQKVSDEIYSRISQRNRVNSYMPALRKAFVFRRSWRNSDLSLLWKGNKSVSLEDLDFDHCVSILQGADINERKCSIPDHCYYLETVSNTKGYHTTHQVLFFLVADNIYCHDAVIRRLGSEEEFEKILDVRLANIYNDMLQSVGTNGFYADLFAERGVLCGMLGGFECFRLDWAKSVLDSVQEMGCVFDDYKDYEKRDEQLIGSCSVHETAVTLGYLANLLRFIMVPPPCHMLK